MAIVTIGAENLPNVIELPRRIEAVKTAELRARTDGIVLRRLYREGTDVREGTPLFQIDPQEYRAHVQQSQAALQWAMEARANAASVFARYCPPVADRSAIGQENDSAVPQLRQADAQVAEARATLAQSQLQLSFTTVRAPLSGRVGQAQVTEGTLVSGTEATLMTRVDQLAPVYAVFTQSILRSLIRPTKSVRVRSRLSSGSHGPRMADTVKVSRSISRSSMPSENCSPHSSNIDLRSVGLQNGVSLYVALGGGARELRTSQSRQLITHENRCPHGRCKLMPECPPRNWIGTSLRPIYANTLESPLPTGTAALVAKIEANLSLQTFAHDLTTMMPRLRAYARSLTRDSDVAEDLVQDTMLKAWQARDHFAPGTSLRAWTSTILRNLFITQRRRARFNGDYDEQVAEIRLARRETQSAVVELGDVRRAMEELVPDQREALWLVAIEGLSYEEGACRVGISLGSFKSRVWRGRSMLQSMINGDVVQSASVTHVKPSEAPTPPAKRPDRNGAWSAAKAAGRPFWIG